MELRKWEELKDEKNICILLGSIGVSYSDQGNNLEALQYYLKSLKLAEKINDQERIITNLCNIGLLYELQGDLDKALEYHFSSLRIAEKEGKEKYIANNRGNIGNLYATRNQYGKALESYLIALKIEEKTGNKGNISALLANIGDVYRQQADSAREKGNSSAAGINEQKALDYLAKSLTYSKELGNEYLQGSALTSIGSIYITQKKYREAEDYLLKGQKIASSINAPDLLMDSHQRLYELYKALGQAGRSLGQYEKYVQVKDSLDHENNRKILSELEVKYETEKKEAENKALAQENQLQSLAISNHRYFIAAMCGLLLMVLCIAFLTIRQNKLKSRQLALQFEQKLLRTQMNPHFIFNSLSSIESFIYDHQPREAGEYLSGFSRLMRLILENSASEYIQLETEIEMLNYYLSLQRLRLDDNLLYNITVDKNLDQQEILIPPMLTQPFIENAIEHGFSGSTRQGEIKVSFTRLGNDMKVEIIDNGIGIIQAEKQKKENKSHKSKAMQITLERLKYLNKSKNRKLTFNIVDLSEEKDGLTGTKVTFSVPV
jgi:tetratricopeptide (TPR) repeat protein